MPSLVELMEKIIKIKKAPLGFCRDDKLLADLGGAATAVIQALNDLLQHIKKGAGPTNVGLIMTINEVKLFFTQFTPRYYFYLFEKIHCSAKL